MKRYFFISFTATLALLSQLSHANNFEKKFLAGGGISRNTADVKDLPGGTFEKNIGGYLFNAAYYFTPSLSIWYQYHHMEDIDVIFDEGDGDLDVESNTLFLAAERYLNDSNFFARGKLGLSYWKADGYTSQDFELGLSGLSEGRSWAFIGTYGVDEESKFEGDDINAIAGIEFGYAIRRRVEFVLGTQFMRGDMLDQNSLLFIVNAKFP